MAEHTELIKQNIDTVLQESFLEYAGYNLQRRAIPDVRDGLKWGARQLLHAQMLGGFTCDKPFKKAIKSVSQAMGFSYVHGDASAYGTLIRMAKPFSYRVPLQEANGNYGTLINPDDHSASRYVELRGSKVAAKVLEDLKKDTITEWEDTYDLEGQFPKVLPSKGIWLGVNGCISIGSGMACSIPPTNLKEVNEAFIKLINNPNISEDELICLPDFPTGAVLLNAEEVKESMKNGYGHACKIRAVVEYDKTERCLIVKEMPYSTFTNTICNELAALMEENPNCGIKNFVDYTGVKPDLRIYLDKKANPERVLKLLYKETSLQTHFSINMVMLDKGTTPRTFGWKEALQAHIDHEKEVYLRGYQYDIKKIEDRLHIIEGLLICLANIDEVVRTIKSSESTQKARQRLMENYNLDEAQTKAILDMKLARLAHLEVEKLISEKSKLEKERDFIYNIINNEDEFNAQLIKGWRDVANKFGDARRTQILNIAKEDEEPTETHELLINLSNQNNIYITTVSTLYTQRRGGVGNKFKMSKGEYVIATASGTNLDTVLLFSNQGNCYSITPHDLPFEEVIPIESLVEIKSGEQIKELVFLNKKKQKEHIIFLTKNGVLKKSKLSEYNVKRRGGVKALNLDSGDEIVSILFVDNERIGMMTARGQFVMCETKDIRAIGRAARGVKGITLNTDDYLVCAKVITPDTKELLTISEKGYIKRTSISEFSCTGRATKGSRIHVLNDTDDALVGFGALNVQKEVIVVASNAQIKINLNEVKLLSKGAQGTKSIKLKNAKVIGILAF